MVACFWPATGFLLDSSNKNNSSELQQKYSHSTARQAKGIWGGKKKRKIL